MDYNKSVCVIINQIEQWALPDMEGCIHQEETQVYFAVINREYIQNLGNKDARVKQPDDIKFVEISQDNDIQVILVDLLNYVMQMAKSMMTAGGLSYQEIWPNEMKGYLFIDKKLFEYKVSNCFGEHDVFDQHIVTEEEAIEEGWIDVEI